MATTPPLAFRGPGRLYVTITGASGEVEAYCELLGVKMVGPNEILEVTGGCGPISPVGPTRWSFNLTYVQDVSSPDTLTRISKQYASQYADFVFVPTGKTKDQISDTDPGYTGRCTITASDIGALATELAQANPTWPITGEPEEVTTPITTPLGRSEPVTSGSHG